MADEDYKKIIRIDNIKLNDVDEQILEILIDGLLNDKIHSSCLSQILERHLEMLEFEEPNQVDTPFHNLRKWIFKNIFKVHGDCFIDTQCDEEAVQILEKMPWVIKYLVQLHLMIKFNKFDTMSEKRRILKKLGNLFIADIFLCNRTDSKVELTDTIRETIIEYDSD